MTESLDSFQFNQTAYHELIPFGVYRSIKIHITSVRERLIAYLFFLFFF